MKKILNDQKGQALVALLMFITVAVVIIGGVVALTVVSTQSSSKYNQSESAYYIAETGIEEAIVRLLRNPDFGNPMVTISIGKGSAKIEVRTEGTIKTITSEGTYGNFYKKIEVKGEYVDTFKILNWKEIN